MDGEKGYLSGGNPQKLKTPKAELARMQAVHLGVILFNLQFLAVAFMLAGVFSFIVVVLFYFFMIIVTLGSLGIIYLLYPSFGSWWAGGEVLQDIAVRLAGGWVYAVPIALALSVSSIILLSFDSEQRHVGRIVVCVIVALLTVAFLIFKWLNAGGAA